MRLNLPLGFGIAAYNGVLHQYNIHGSLIKRTDLSIQENILLN